MKPSVAANGTPLDDSDDAELLDLLQAQHDASLLAHMDREAAAAGEAMRAVHNSSLPETHHTSRSAPIQSPWRRGAIPTTSRSTSTTATTKPTTLSSSAAGKITVQLLVGGSLFSPRRPRLRWRPSIAQHTATTKQRTGLWLLDARGRLATMSALSVGSLYCPFTHQFVSLHSPHWCHLQAVGFGPDVSVRSGRRMTLLSSGKLYRFACELQGSPPNFTARGAMRRGSRGMLCFGENGCGGGGGRGKAKDGDECVGHDGRNKTPLPTHDHTKATDTQNRRLQQQQQRAAACYAARGWSPLLTRSLGTILESAPTTDSATFRESIMRVIAEECDPLRIRGIDLSYVPFTGYRDIGGGRPPYTQGAFDRGTSKVRGRGSPCDRADGPTNLLAWRSLLGETGAKDGGNGTALSATGRERLGVFGNNFMQSTARWRQHVLQRLPKSAEIPPRNVVVVGLDEESGERKEVRVVDVSSAAVTITGMAGWADTVGGERRESEEWPSLPLMDRPVKMLPGLPADTRVAAVALQPRDDTAVAWDAEMRDTVKRMLHQLQETFAACEATRTVRLYVCPLEHCVDYSSVLDLVAFPVNVSCGVAEQPVHLLSLGLDSLCGSDAIEATTPPMTAGTDATRGHEPSPPRRTVVVIANAHLLSRRAVGRLLDQWTRNGAAHRSLVAHHNHCHCRVYHSRRCAEYVRTREEGKKATEAAAGDDAATAAATPTDAAREAAAEAEAAVRAATVRWRLLLREDPFVSTTRIRYTRPFGFVQALLVSHDFSAHRWKAKEKDRTTAAVFEDPAKTIAISRQAATHGDSGEDLFHLQEPLAAALLRCGSTLGRLPPHTHTETYQASRVGFLRAVCAAVVRQLPATQVLQHLHSKTGPSGRRLFQEVSVPLQSLRGQRLLFQACEAVLNSQTVALGSGATGAAATGVTTTGSPSIATPALNAIPNARRVEELMQSYPFLSKIQCRHRLVRRYTVADPTHAATSVSAPTDTSSSSTAPTDSTMEEESVEVMPVMGTRAVREREACTNTMLLRLARGTILAAAVMQRAGAGSSDTTTATTLTAESSEQTAQPFGNTRPPRPLLEQHYHSLAEPPVLLGLWTATALFCAPAVADVMPLRHYLLDRLATHRFAIGAREKSSCSGADSVRSATLDRSEASERTSATLEVIDVVIFHIDFVIFPLDRRCRLYGCRCLLQPSCQGGDTNMDTGADATTTTTAAAALANAYTSLHSLLKRCASEAVFFPLWTYHVLQRSVLSTCYVPGTTLPDSTSAVKMGTGYHFAAIDEWTHPCTPSLVERKLFALEAAQRGPLRLVVGSHVVLLRDIQLRAASRTSDRDEEEGELCIRRGTVCRVESFVRAESSTICSITDQARAKGREPHQLMLPLAYLSSASTQQATHRYMEQQRDAVALPILRPVNVGQQSPATAVFNGKLLGKGVCFVLTPLPTLLGGYRSLHYYALPVLHLPIHVLVPNTSVTDGTPPRAFFKNRTLPHTCRTPTTKPRDGSCDTTVPGTQRPVMCYPTRQLFHPYHADRDALATLVLSARQRAAVYDALICSPPLEGNEKSGGNSGNGGDDQGCHTSVCVDDTVNPFLLVEDLILQEDDEVAATPLRGGVPQSSVYQTECPSPSSCAGAELPLLRPNPLTVATVPTKRVEGLDDNGKLPSDTISCPILTCVSLYAYVEEDQ